MSKISIFENKNDNGQYYTFRENPITGETVFYSVYFPRGYKVKPEDIKTSKNGKRYVICDAEPKTSQKTGKVYFQVIVPDEVKAD